MANKIKYNSQASRWELLDAANNVIDYAVGSVGQNPSDLSWGSITVTTGPSKGATADASDIREGETAVVDGVLLSGTMSDMGSFIYTPTASGKVSGAGYYDTVYIEGDTDLKAENIKKGVSVFGVEGSYEAPVVDTTNLTAGNIKAGVTINGVTGTFTDDATVESSDMLKGTTAYANGTKVTGNMEDHGDYTWNVTSKSYTPLPSGHYLSVDLNIAGIDNIQAGNIRSGVSILGVTGTLEEGSDVDFSGASSGIANYLMSGYKAFDNTGALISGTAENYTDQYSSLPVRTVINWGGDGSYGDIVMTPTVSNTAVVSNESMICAQVEGLIPSNIKKGVTIGYLTGTYEGVTVSDPIYDVQYETTVTSEDVYTFSTYSEFMKDIPAGWYKYGARVVCRMDNLIASNIKSGVSILGITGTYEGGPSVDLSGVTAEAQYVLSGQKFVNSSGTLVNGTALDARAIYGRMEVTSIDVNMGEINLKPLSALMPEGTAIITPQTTFFCSVRNILMDGTTITPTKSVQIISSKGKLFYGDITINPIPDEYIVTSGATATAADITKGKTAWANGTLLEGTHEDSAVGGGGMEFYECANAGSGSTADPNTIILGENSNWGDGLNAHNFVGTYVNDSSLTGADRRFINQNNPEYVILYDTTMNTAGSFILTESIAGYGLPYWMNTILLQSPTMDANATVEEICAAEWFVTDAGNVTFNFNNPPSFSTISSGDSGSDTSTTTWSGYKMEWREGISSPAVSAIRISGTTNGIADGDYVSDTALTGADRKFINASNANAFIVWDGDGWALSLNGTNRVAVTNTDNSGDMPTSSIEYICSVGFRVMFNGNGVIGSVGDAVSAEAVTIGGGGSLDGWYKTDTLTEGLEVKGYTPEVGKVYNEDTTALVYLHPDQPIVEVISTTATAGDILAGKTAVLNGELVTGTLEKGPDVDLSGVTAEAQYVLSGQKFVNSSGTLVTGTAGDARENYGRMEVVSVQDEYGSGDRLRINTTPVAIYGNTAIITPNTKFWCQIDAMPAQTITPTKSTQTIAGDKYLYGGVTINPIPAEYITTTDANATAADIAKDKTAYVNGQKITGTMEASSGDSTVKFGYWTAEGKFQEIDLSGDSPVDIGEPVTVDAVMFATGKPSPEYN